MAAPPLTLRPLGRGDAAVLEAFLARHADESMFLRSNARGAGLEDHGEPLQGTYVAAFAHGEIIAVAAHYWNGMVVLQAPAHAGDVARAALELSQRELRGLAGPWEHVAAARAALGAANRAAGKDSRETLYALALTQLVVPEPLAAGRWICRHARSDEGELLVDWRVAYSVEALGESARAGLREACRAEVSLIQQSAADFVLEDGGRPVAFAAYNAQLPDIVQIGGVWTPPALRSRGYGGAVTAGALRAAREAGVVRGVLFTDNPAAVRAYERIGFRSAGEYGLVLFR